MRSHPGIHFAPPRCPAESARRGSMRHGHYLYNFTQFDMKYAQRSASGRSSGEESSKVRSIYLLCCHPGLLTSSSSCTIPWLDSSQILHGQTCRQTPSLFLRNPLKKPTISTQFREASHGPQSLDIMAAYCLFYSKRPGKHSQRGTRETMYLCML
jgi:hypothetical protein